jgi:hypothetical protein
MYLRGPGSNLGPSTLYSVGFNRIFQSLSENCRTDQERNRVHHKLEFLAITDQFYVRADCGNCSLREMLVDMKSVVSYGKEVGCIGNRRNL